MDKIYAYVSVLDAPYSIDKKYIYFIPEELRADITVGSLCVVPFGNSNKKQTAVVLDFDSSTEYSQVKPVFELLEYPVKPGDEELKLCTFMRERFFCTFGAALKSILPPGIGIKTRYLYRALEYDSSVLNEKAAYVYDYISATGASDELSLISKFGEEVTVLLSSLQRLGAVSKESGVEKKVNERVITVYRIADEYLDGKQPLPRLSGSKQEAVAAFLQYGGTLTVRESEEMFSAGRTVFTSLIKKGIVVKTVTRSERFYQALTSEASCGGFTLSEEQNKAFLTISGLMDSGKPKGVLLYGVTGSGKTKVIIECCKKALSQGKTAMVLMPEIGLTAQATALYRASFGNELAIIHSMLSNGERIDTYRSIKEGKIRIVIGTRSAVFAPLSKLGIIVLDEEQEHTYKSDLTPKYHARDIARFRCGYHGATMLLASATPSVESFFKAKNGVYTLVELKKRFSERPLPKVMLADVRGNNSPESSDAVGEVLRNAVNSALSTGNQVILFTNRRGYNSHLTCNRCGHVFTCPNCSVSLTYHAVGGISKTNRLICHYCGYIEKKPATCPECGSEHIGYFGYGTQRLEAELEKMFPSVGIVRMDADTTTEKHSHEEILSDFSKGKYDILFGTQMVAKGLDFPRVSLVGVINADASLYMNDFRAGERTFSLFTQLVGRSGRGEKEGSAVIQTCNPENEILRLAAKQDYVSFYESEILLRKSVLFPPFCDILVFIFSADTEDEVNDAAEIASGRIKSFYTQNNPQIPFVVLGPFGSGAIKLKNKFRQNIIIKYQDKIQSRQFIAELYRHLIKLNPKNVRIDIDINPNIV